MMKNKLIYSISALALAVLGTTTVSGYALLSPARRWFNADTPRQVNVDNGGLSSVTGGDPNHGVTAAVNAVTAWNGGGVNVTSSSSAGVAYRQGDGISDVIFGDPLHLCTGSCIAATLTGYYSTSTTGTCGGLTVDKITDADVSFNLAYNYTTVAQGSCSNEIYLESVMTHEIGHVIGLAHSNTSSALMYPTVSYCNNKAIASDDTAGRNALYNCTLVEGGGGGCQPAGSSCTSNSQCCSNSCKGKPGNKSCR
jgi:hypothetical protein